MLQFDAHCFQDNSKCPSAPQLHGCLHEDELVLLEGRHFSVSFFFNCIAKVLLQLSRVAVPEDIVLLLWDTGMVLSLQMVLILKRKLSSFASPHTATSLSAAPQEYAHQPRKLLEIPVFPSAICTSVLTQPIQLFSALSFSSIFIMLSIHAWHYGR